MSYGINDTGSSFILYLKCSCSLGMGIAKKSVSRYIAIRDERIAIRITIFYQFYLREFLSVFV